MKQLAILYVLIGLALAGQGQTLTEVSEGKVSYITSQNIYVKFVSTEGLSVGDTLFINQGEQTVPALVINSLSSISCVCTPLSTLKLTLGDTLLSKQRQTEIPEPEIEPLISITPLSPPNPEEEEETTDNKKKNKQAIHGRLSLASYSNFSNTPGGNSQRMRYTFSMKADKLANSKFSAETYISFVHRDKHWNEIKDNVFNGLKIYNLAVKYEPTEHTKIWLGRKVNPNISNLGAIDGLQFEQGFKSISVGAFAGSRPDYLDYGFNAKLFQYGAYVGHNYAAKNGSMQTTLAFAEQQNDWKTDRRFMYLQHFNSLAKNLNFFGTAEFELYQNVNGVQQSNLNVTNLYLMLRYQVVRKLSFSVSYSARQNLIYYETYKDYVEKLLEQETLQGYRFSVNYRPFKKVAVGVKVGYRSRKTDPSPSKNLYGYLSFSQIPGIDATATLSATLLETAYLKGSIYSLNISRDLIPGKLYSGLSYRFVDYQYVFYELTQQQHIGELNLSWRIIKNLSLTVAYEGTFDQSYTYNRVYVNLSKRF